MHFIKNWLLFSLMLCFAIGCASHPTNNTSFVSEGFRISPPGLKARTVLWGNNPESLTHANDWLNDHDLLVLHRWADPTLDLLEMLPFPHTQQQTYIQSVAKKVGAHVMIFVHVNKTPPTNMIKVTIQGVDVDTEDIIFEGQAWNSTPVPTSNELMKDLTTLAFHKALVDSQPSSPSVKKMETEDTSTHLAESDISPLTSSSKFSENKTSSNHSSLGIQIASGALSVLYTPFKLAYATLGGIFGGLAYAVTGGNEETTEAIWDASLGGNYWITPEHLSGEQVLLFIGP